MPTRAQSTLAAPAYLPSPLSSPPGSHGMSCRWPTTFAHVYVAQAQEKQYAAQMARRKETMKTLRAKDEAPLARPKGYDPNSVGGNKVSRDQAAKSRAVDLFFALRFSLGSTCSSSSGADQSGQPERRRSGLLVPLDSNARIQTSLLSVLACLVSAAPN